MRKSTFFLLATMCGLPALAQLQQLPANEQTKADLTPVVNLQASAKSRVFSAKALKPITTEPVLTQPEGKLVNAAWYGKGFYPISGYSRIFSHEMEARATTYVNQGDTAIWIKNSLTEYEGEQGWIRISKVDNKGNWELRTPQAIMVRTNSKNEKKTFYVTKLGGSTPAAVNERGYTVGNNLNIRFRMDSKGVLSQVTTDGSEILGLTDGEGTWYPYGSYGYKYIANEDTPVKKPANLEVTKYVWANTINKQGSETIHTFVNVGYSGNDIYMSSPADTTLYFKGTILGNKVFFKSPQFMGVSKEYNRLLYFSGVRFAWDDNSPGGYKVSFVTGDIIFDYDATSHTLVLPKEYAIVAKVFGHDTYNIYASPSLRIYPFIEKAATPQAPQFWKPERNFRNYTYDERIQKGIAQVQFIISPHDVNGEYINPDSMYYRMYVDDPETPFTFDKIDYPALPKDEMTEIPFWFTDKEYIMGYTNTLRLLFFFTEVQDSIGFQSVYKGGGETRESNIAWYKLPKTTSIQGIHNSNNGSPAKVYYDLLGRRQEGLRKGINLIRKEDGSVEKVIQ